MKTLVLLCLLNFIALSSAIPHNRGCIYIFGKCYTECPEGTHSYTPNYSEPWNWEPTCKKPNPVLQGSPIFDYSACYCDLPTVRDTAGNKCVTLDKCPKEEKAEKDS